jgi:hypothetical protein
MQEQGVECKPLKEYVLQEQTQNGGTNGSGGCEVFMVLKM